MSESTRAQDFGRRAAVGSRHVSMRIPIVLYERLEALAGNSNETVSQCARRLLSNGLESSDRDAIDDAISALLLMRSQQTQHRHVERPDTPIESRTVNVLNAKTDLQHLLADVERGVEIIITHAGTQRARLVQVAGSLPPNQPARNS